MAARTPVLVPPFAGFALRALRLVAVLALLLLLATLVSCSPKPVTKRYHLKGKVVTIDKRANMANIDGEDIPGFMGAMVMPYVVKPPSELDELSPGDAITADVVVQGDTSWIENVTVASHSTPPAK